MTLLCERLGHIGSRWWKNVDEVIFSPCYCSTQILMDFLWQQNPHRKLLLMCRAIAARTTKVVDMVYSTVFLVEEEVW